MSNNSVFESFGIFNQIKFRSGCYYRSLQQGIGVFDAMPLKHIDYEINIFNNVAKVSMQQEYTNPSSSVCEIQFVVPITPKVCVHKFTARFGQNEIKGVVEQKIKAESIYEKQKNEGNQVALTRLKSESDCMIIQLGNVLAKQSVMVRIEYITQLEVSMNTFWKLVIPSKISPNYMNLNSADKMKTSTWSFKISLMTSKQCTFHMSNSHSLIQLSTNQSKTENLFVMEQAQSPNLDFTFLFSVKQFQLPMVAIGKTDQCTSSMISLIPRFCDLQVDDAYKVQKTSRSFDFDLQSAKGEYIFVLDRSGSMSGKRISKATEALCYFIKSLPQDSYFEVYSFGSSHQRLFNQQLKYCDISVNRAYKAVSKYVADMGGTNIYQPLKQIFDSNSPKDQIRKEYPRHIFLLTDGQVNNTTAIISLIKNNRKFCRVHTIGIGNQASVQLITGCAEAGKGGHTFIKDDENVSAKIIKLLEEALSPVITNFKFEFDEQIVQSIIPNPADMPFILKNQPLRLFLIFKDKFEGKTKVKLSYKDSLNNQNYESQLSIDTTQDGVDYVDKMANYTMLQILANNIKNNGKLSNDILIAHHKNYKDLAIKKSVHHQILCDLTAFIAVSSQISDSQKHQITRSKISSQMDIQLPQPRRIPILFNQISQRPSSGLFNKGSNAKGGFGTSLFIQNQGTASNNLFGSSSQATSSLFGSTTSSSLFGSFSQTPSSSLFGSTSQSGLFGQPQHQSLGGLFGSQTNSFSHNQNSLFSQNMSTSNQQSLNSNSLFGSSNISKSIMDHSASGSRGGSRGGRGGGVARKKSKQKQSQKSNNDRQKSYKKQDKSRSRSKAKQNETQRYQSKQQCKEKTQKDAKQNLSTIISLQKSDGTWDIDSLSSVLQIIGLKKKQVEEVSKNYHNNLNFVLTVLICRWLEKNFNNQECKLIIKKSNSWISKSIKMLQVDKECKDILKLLS